jgi:hypothetical protein
MKQTLKKSLKNRKQKGAGQVPAGTTADCDICGETKLMVSAFECMHTMCKDCIDTWIRRNPTCPECRSEVKADYTNTLLSARPRQRSLRQEGELMHFMPLIANNPITGRASVLDAVVSTGAVLSLRNYLFDSIRTGIDVEDVIGLSILFLFAFLVGTMLYRRNNTSRQRGYLRGALRMIIGVTLLGTELSLLQNRFTDIFNAMHRNNVIIGVLECVFPRRGGGGKNLNEENSNGELKAEIHININRNAKREDIESFLREIFSNLFDEKKQGFHVHDTTITLPDVKFKMEDVHNSDFYKKLMQFNNRANSGPKAKTIKQGRSSSGRKSKSSRRSRSSARSV